MSPDFMLTSVMAVSVFIDVGWNVKTLCVLFNLLDLMVGFLMALEDITARHMTHQNASGHRWQINRCAVTWQSYPPSHSFRSMDVTSLSHFPTGQAGPLVARVVTDFNEQQNILTLTCPALSPDLPPVEHLKWNIRRPNQTVMLVQLRQALAVLRSLRKHIVSSMLSCEDYVTDGGHGLNAPTDPMPLSVTKSFFVWVLMCRMLLAIVTRLNAVELYWMLRRCVKHHVMNPMLCCWAQSVCAMGIQGQNRSPVYQVWWWQHTHIPAIPERYYFANSQQDTSKG